jgi:hypothetical protein
MVQQNKETARQRIFNKVLISLAYITYLSQTSFSYHWLETPLLATTDLLLGIYNFYL